MKKGVLIAIGIIVVISIVILLNVNNGKEIKITQNPSSNSTAPSPTPPPVIPPAVTQGRNFSVNLTESVGVGAH